MLEVEDWTQPASSTKQRRSSTKKATDSQTPRKSSPEPISTAEPTLEPPPGPPDPDTEVEEVFPARSPTSHLPNSRARTSSPSAAAGPSSLSRLLAQAPVEDSSVVRAASSHTTSTPEKHPFLSPPASSPRQPSPVASPEPRQPSASPRILPSNAQVMSPPRAGVPLPGRPGSRASRMSSSSKFSSGRIPFAGTAGPAKAIATTALNSELSISGSPSSLAPSGSTGSETVSPSPEGSPTEGLSQFLPNHRRRPKSYHPSSNKDLLSVGPGGLPTIAQAVSVDPGNSNSAQSGLVGPGPPSLSARVRLASLASSWGVPFGRRRASESASPPGPPGTSSNGLS